MSPFVNLPVSTDDSVSVAAVLADTVRRRLYFHVRACSAPVTRDEAAAAVGISRDLAAFHLEKLAAAALVEPAPADSAPDGPRPEGRPPKRYRIADAGLHLDIPPRQYDLIAAILLEGMCETGGDRAESARLAAHRRGVDLGAATREGARAGRLGRDRAVRLAVQALVEQGYEPDIPERRPVHIRLRNCPFHGLMDVRDPRLVCRLNQSFVDGILDGLQIEYLRGVLEALPGRCCVAVRERGAETR